MAVTPSNLIALLDLQLRLLKFSEYDPYDALERTGDLRVLFIGPRGWRPDGVARTRAFLNDAITAITGNEVIKPSKGLRQDHVGIALRKMWGVVEFPASATRVAAELWDSVPKTADEVLSARVVQALAADDSRALAAVSELPRAVLLSMVAKQVAATLDREAPSPETMSDWGRKAIGSTKLAEWVESDWISGQRHDIAAMLPLSVGPTEQRPQWLRESHESWPSPAWVQSVGPEIDERDSLLQTAREALGDALTNAERSDDTALNILRRAVTDELLGSYFAHTDFSSHFTHLLLHIDERWFSDFPYASQFRRGKASSLNTLNKKGTFATTTAVAAQAIFYAIAADERRLRFVAKRLRAAGMMAAAVASPVTMDALTGIEIVDDLEYANWRAEQPELPKVKPAKSWLVESDWPHPFTGMVAFEVAEKIRRESNPILRLGACKRYVHERATLAEKDIPEFEAILLGLADQSVQLDIVWLKERPLEVELGKLITSAKASLSTIYNALVSRNDALMWLKGNYFEPAQAALAAGFAHVRKAKDAKLFTQKAFVETIHQLSLAGANINLSLLTEALVSEPPGRWAKPAAVAAANFSTETSRRLFDLEDRKLTSARHEDHHISSVEWRVQTQLVRLRTMLTIHTAMRSKVIIGPFTDIRDKTFVDTSLENIKKAYRETLLVKELKTSHETEVVRLALWLAMLNSDALPIVRKPTLKNLVVILGDPDDADGNFDVEQPVDTHEIVGWLRDNGSDAGILSQVDKNGKVAELFLPSAAAAVMWHNRRKSLQTPG